MALLDIEMGMVIEIHPQEQEEYAYNTQSISSLLKIGDGRSSYGIDLFE